MQRSLAPYLLMFVLVGCSVFQRSEAPDGPPIPRQILPIPEDLRDEVAQAQLLGAAIYMQDAASAAATDELIRNIGSLDGKDVGGWITVRDVEAGGRPTDWWLVQFYSESQPGKILYEVSVPMRPGKQLRYQAYNPPADADSSARQLIAARSLAIAAIPPAQQPMNTVILPGKPFQVDGILVYLLAATTDPDTIVLGKHYRVTVASDGSGVTHTQELSRSDLKVALRRPNGERIVAPWVQHTLTDFPPEGYVFASLFHHTPIMIGTARGVWWIKGDEIDLIATETPQRPVDLLKRSSPKSSD